MVRVRFIVHMGRYDGITKEKQQEVNMISLGLWLFLIFVYLPLGTIWKLAKRYM